MLAVLQVYLSVGSRLMAAILQTRAPCGFAVVHDVATSAAGALLWFFSV